MGGINPYMLPAQYMPEDTYTSQHVGLPLEELDKALGKREKEVNKDRDEAIAAGDIPLYGLDPDAEIVEEAKKKYKQEAEEIANMFTLEATLGGGENIKKAKKMKAKMFNELKQRTDKESGDLGSAMRNYDTRAAWAKAMKTEGYSEGEINAFMNSVDAEYARNKGIGEADEHGRFKGFNTRDLAEYSDITTMTNTLAKEMEATVSEEGGIWKLAKDYGIAPGKIQQFEEWFTKTGVVTKELKAAVINEAMKNAIQNDPKANNFLWSLAETHSYDKDEYGNTRGDDEAITEAYKELLESKGGVMGAIHSKFDSQVDSDLKVQSQNKWKYEAANGLGDFETPTLTSITTGTQSAIPVINKTVDENGKPLVMEQDGTNGKRVNRLKAAEIQSKMAAWVAQTTTGKNGAVLPFSDVEGLKKLAEDGQSYGELSNSDLIDKIAEYESLETEQKYNQIQQEEADAAARNLLSTKQQDLIGGTHIKERYTTELNTEGKKYGISGEEMFNVYESIKELAGVGNFKAAINDLQQVATYVEKQGEDAAEERFAEGESLVSMLPGVNWPNNAYGLYKKYGKDLIKGLDGSTLTTQVGESYKATKQAETDYDKGLQTYYSGKAVINYDVETQNMPLIYKADGGVDMQASNKTMDEIGLAVAGDVHLRSMDVTGLGTKDATSIDSWAKVKFGKDYVIDNIVFNDTDKKGRRDVRYVASTPNGPAVAVKISVREKDSDSFTAAGTKEVIVPLKDYLKFSGITANDKFKQTVKVDDAIWKFKSSGVNAGMPDFPVKGFQFINDNGTVKAKISGKIYPLENKKSKSGEVLYGAKSYLYKTL